MAARRGDSPPGSWGDAPTPSVHVMTGEAGGLHHFQSPFFSHNNHRDHRVHHHLFTYPPWLLRLILLLMTSSPVEP